MRKLPFHIKGRTKSENFQEEDAEKRDILAT